MFQVVYLSSARTPFTKDELIDLMARSRESNARLGLTGILLHHEGSFMQALEGEEGAVLSTYRKIERDPRHGGLLVLLRGPIAERRFPDWSMAYRELRSEELAGMPGYSPLMNTPFSGMEFASDPTACERLLMSFKRNMRLAGAGGAR